jgi:DNA-binding NarL/FixJ family response regulator
MIATVGQGSEGNEPCSFDGLPPLSQSHAQGSGTDQASKEGSRTLQPATYQAPSRSTTISLALIDEYSFTREAVTRSLQYICDLLIIESFGTSDQCLQSKKNYDLIMYNKHDIIEIQNTNDARLADIKKLSALAPVILLCDADSFELLRVAFDCGVRGYIPIASTTLEIAVEIIHLVRAGGIFVPPSSLFPRRIKLPAIRDPITTQKFTPRQMAVLERLKLGQTNKIIAFELHMSESSVKTHIQNIMKKMNATNRTEVACLAQKLELNGLRAMDYSKSL